MNSDVAVVGVEAEAEEVGEGADGGGRRGASRREVGRGTGASEEVLELGGS